MEIIRKAERRDTDRILELLVQVERVHYDARPDLFRGPEPHTKYSAGELERMIGDPSRPIFVIEDGGLVCGYAFCELISSDGDPVLRDSLTLYIDDLCVDRDSRGRGYGTKLLDFVTGFARGAGCCSVTLNVWCGNDAAMRFYGNAGMSPRKITMEKNITAEDRT